MDEILKFFNGNGLFYLATIDGEQARVRPIGSLISYKGKLSFSTNMQKDVYRQMAVNPFVEICSVDANGTSLRVSGKLQFYFGPDARETFFLALPYLRDVYKGQETKMAVCCFENAKVTRLLRGGAKETTVLY